MANKITFKEQSFCIGDTITIDYKIKEGAKERIQAFKGILMKVKGDGENTRMITVRKVSNTGIGIERIIPLMSPFIADMRLEKKANYHKSKLNFIRDLSGQQLRRKLYRQDKNRAK
ncbi:MAG: ribosomal protein [Candidatus Parcubacteria bacterium]|jgi:large subunit ribosomal protein L19